MLVVGAGEVAERKVGSLLGAGATVHVVAPEATPALEQRATAGTIDWKRRGFVDADVDGAWLVFAATDDATTQRVVSEACRARRVFCIAVDDPPNATAYSGAVVRRAPFTIAISSSGATPALTRLVRELVEQVLPGEQWVTHAQQLRARWKADGTPMADRFAELVREIARPTARPPEDRARESGTGRSEDQKGRPPS